MKIINVTQLSDPQPYEYTDHITWLTIAPCLLAISRQTRCQRLTRCYGTNFKALYKSTSIYLLTQLPILTETSLDENLSIIRKSNSWIFRKILPTRSTAVGADFVSIAANQLQSVARRHAVRHICHRPPISSQNRRENP